MTRHGLDEQKNDVTYFDLSFLPDVLGAMRPHDKKKEEKISATPHFDHVCTIVVVRLTPGIALGEYAFFNF
jgi:hypothetical protein